ncbi:MAG: tetratricopeptide repeat protein [Syntrophothermus sp.]
MYLPKSSRWSMTRRRRRPNIFGWTIFGLVLLFGYYLNQIYLPSQPNPFDATPTATRSAESLETEGQQLFKEGKLPQAIDAYKAAIKASPQDPNLYIALARIQVFAGLPAEAQANAESAILLSPNNSMAHAVRAWALDFQDGKNTDAEEEINKAIEIDPNNAVAYAYQTEILIDSQLFDNIAPAIEASKKGLNLNPDLMETRRARAYILEATANYEEAIQYYRSAIELNPNLSMLHMELGRNLRFAMVYDDAIKEFTLANTLNPGDPEPDYLISRTYGTTGEYEKALQYAETAVKDNPIEARYRGNYGVMFYRNFKYQEAVQQLGLAIDGGKNENGFPIKPIALNDDPRIAEYYFTYGLALARTNQCGKALPISQTLQSRFPADDPQNDVILEAASSIIQICEENLNNPAVDTPTPASEATSLPEVTDTPEASATPEVTVTP